MTMERLRRHPDRWTAHLAAGGPVGEQDFIWVAESLRAARADRDRGAGAIDRMGIDQLKAFYTSARVLQGGIVAGRIALPAVIDAGRRYRAGDPDVLTRSSTAASDETTRYLNGMLEGRPLERNDYPEELSAMIGGTAQFLDGAFTPVFKKLRLRDPRVVELARDTDELQRLTWALIRRRIDEVVPASEVAEYREGPLRQTSDELLELVRARLGSSVPARVMQRDDWNDALVAPGQDPRLALFTAMRFYVENAEIALLYNFGSVLVRLRLGQPVDLAWRSHLRFGAHDIAAGTRRLTHTARFQSRLGARPNQFRSFAEFLRTVERAASIARVLPSGEVDWRDGTESRIRGWCPAQNSYGSADAGAWPDSLVSAAIAETEDWRLFGRQRDGVEPLLNGSNAAELLGALIVAGTMHETGVLRPGGGLLESFIE